MARNEENLMDLYIATYPDGNAAEVDWDGVKQLAKSETVDVEGLALVTRDSHGKLDVKDDAREVGKGAKVGTIAGAAIGLIFPPAILGSAVVGAVAGSGIGALRKRGNHQDIKDDVEQVLPPNASGIVVLAEDRWSDEIEAAFVGATNVTKHEVDSESTASLRSAIQRR
jgi:uncharacterized membrane protein